MNYPAPPIELAVRGLAFSRGGRMLFSDLDWRAGAGELVAVRGVNGAGKTSLLRLLAGLGIPDSGEVLWCGRSLFDNRPGFNADLSWLGHADGIKADLSPRENLEFHRAMGRPGMAVGPAMEACGVGEVSDLPCRLLSAGQRRRTALARFLVSRAALWILDEPLTALDVEGQGMVSSMVSAHCDAGGIAVVTSHQALPVGRPVLEVVL